MVCVPTLQLALTGIVTSKLPELSALRPVFDTEASCPAIDIGKARVLCVRANRCGAVANSGMLSSRVSVMLAPGKKCVPCTCRLPPVVTVVLPTMESVGGIPKSSPPIVPTRIKQITAIINATNPQEPLPDEGFRPGP